MNREEAILKLKEQRKIVDEGGDKEVPHCEADDILCELLISLGYKDVVDEYEEIEKWYA